jgi:hypothetical protein
MSASAERVYVVQHVHAAPNGEEDVKLIGVYASEQAAAAAVTRLTIRPGFCDHPDGFHVSPYEIDKDHWVEGFISWKEAME